MKPNIIELPGRGKVAPCIGDDLPVAIDDKVVPPANLSGKTDYVDD
jgi:hypothetical protein